MKLNPLFAFLLLLVVAGTAQAQSGRDPFVINPNKSYIFFRASLSGANIRFLRERAPGEGAGTPERFPDPRSWAHIGPNRFSSGREGNGYLREVEPGSYILYGNIGGTTTMHIGWCLCMGSVRFEARAGQIVDLGEIRYAERRSPPPYGVTVVPLTPAMGVPARLVGLPRVPAELHAAGKIPNYFGVGLDRHDPMPGILAYRRDQPIDVRTGRDVPPSGN